MDKIGLGASTAPQAIVRSCRGAMYRPRERTVQDLLQHAYKIFKPTPSPVLTDGARMQGPGVKEECYNCGGSVAAEDLQQCGACDRGFHTTCLDPLVNIGIPGVPWCCGLCENYKGQRGDTGTIDRAAVVSMTSIENTGGHWNSSASEGKKKLTSIRVLKDVVQQDEPCLVNNKLLQAASHEGEANKSKRSCRIKSTSQVLFSKRLQVDFGISKPKTDDGNEPISIPEQFWEGEELAGALIGGTSGLGIFCPASVSVAVLVPGKVPCGVVNAYSNDASVHSVEIRACSITEVDKELHGVRLRVSDGIFQLLATKVISTESSTVVVLAKVPVISMVQMVKSEEFDAPHKMTAEVKLQDVDVDALARHLNDYRQATAAEAGTGQSSTLFSSSENVGNEPPTIVGGQEAKALVADQQVEEQGCGSDPLFIGKEKEIATPTNAGLELFLSEVPQRHVFDSTGEVYLRSSMGSVSSSPSLIDSPSTSVKHSGPAPPFNSAYQSVSTTSSISNALPFVGFQSQSRDIMAFTAPITSQFSKPALERSMVDGNDFLVAKSFVKASGSSSRPSNSLALKAEKIVPSKFFPCVENKPQPAVSLPQTLAAPIALPTKVSRAEALDSHLSKEVSGQPRSAQGAPKDSDASFPILEVDRFVAQVGRKPKAQTMNLSQSVLVHPHASKELCRPSMRDQGAVKIILSTTLENGFGMMEPVYPLSGICKESNGEDDRDGSPSNLLVEDVKVCDTCGNAGYEELLAVCSSCNEGAEHTYCMSTQMDFVPEGNWFCETCQIKQKQTGSRTLERLLVSSKSMGRSTSVNTRPKPVSNQGSSRSRLVDRLYNKKPRIAQEGKSPLKAPVLQTSFQRLPSDFVVSPNSRKLVTESSFLTISNTSPPSRLAVSTPLAKPSLTKESTFKCAPDTGKVKFLAPSAVANFSSGVRATSTKPASVVSQIPKAAATGQAGNKRRFASLSSVSELCTPSDKATNLNCSRASLMSSPSPSLSKLSSGNLFADFSILSKCSDAKLSADFPSFLLNSNSRHGHGMKCSGRIKNSRGGCVPDGVSLPSSSREAPSSASQPSGSKVMRLGRNTSDGLMGEPRPYSDIPRAVLESESGVQRSGPIGEPRPFPDTPRPQIEYGRGSHRGGLGIGDSNAAGTGQDASKVDCNDKASSRFEPASGVGLGGSGRVSFEPAPVPGFPGKQSKPNTSIWSAPWLGDSSSVRCFACKSRGHRIQDCPSPISLASEQKAFSGSSNSLSTSLEPPKNSASVFNDIDANVPAVGSKAGLQEKVNSSCGLQIAIESFPAGCSSGSEKLKPLSPTPTDLVRRRFPNVKLYDSSVAVSKVSSLLNGTFFQKFVSDEISAEVSLSANEDSSFRQELKAEAGPSINLWTSGGAYDNERPPGVPGSETAHVDSKVTALRNNTSPLVISQTGSSTNASQAIGVEVPQRDGIQLTEATVGCAPQVMQRVHRAWGRLPPWLEALPPHAVGDLGPGRVGYPSGLVQSFPPLGPSRSVMYRQGPQIPYLTSQPTPFLPEYASPALPPVPSPMPPPPAAQVDAAVPSAAIAWRGAFEVHDGQSMIVFDEIIAHVSTKAVAKVHEVATSLPQQLRLEQVQRSTDLETWPRQFNLRPPTDGSIALYFFATNGESFDKFRYNLVNKMVALDLVLRAHVDDAELLIFPSDKLSDKFQRWHGHTFLWGVFRARKQAVKTVSTSTVEVKEPLVAAFPLVEVSIISPHLVPRAAPVCNITPKTKHPNSSSTGYDIPVEIDMEVDMEGGKDCGRSDKPIKRPDSANPPSTPPLSPTGVSIRAPTVSAPECPLLNTDYADNVLASIKPEDLDLPPGFAPGLALPPTPVAPETHIPGLTLPPGFPVKTDTQKQVDFGSSAGTLEDPEKGGSKPKRSITSLELLKNSSTPQTPPHFVPRPKEDAEISPPLSRPSPTKRSFSKSHSPSRAKEKGRENVRDRLCEWVNDRDKKEPDSKHERRDNSREWAREVHRDRDRDREYKWGKVTRHRSMDRDRDVDTYDRSNERARPRDKDRAKQRGRARERNRERDRDRERVREREREKERHLDRVKDRKSYRLRDSDQNLDSRIRFRCSRSRSRSRSPARRKRRSWSPGAGRRKARSRTPSRQRTRSPSPSRRYLGNYRQFSVSGSDSRGSQSLEILQTSLIAGPRSRKPDRESVQEKRSITSDKVVGDRGSRPSSRWKSARTVDDARSGSAGGSNSKAVGKLGHPDTVRVSRSVTPVLDMNEGVSEAFSAQGAAASTSLPDLNTDSVDSSVAYHNFLPADKREPETASLIAEQIFPGTAHADVTASLSTRVNPRNQDAEPILARERWGFAVSSLGLRPDYTSRSCSAYQFIHAPRLEDSIHNPNPDLELALGGRETASSERTVPLPLFLNGHTRITPNLGFALNAKSPDLSVGLSNPYQSGPLDMVHGGTASLSLSLAVPQYRREVNSSVQECEDVSDRQVVDFSLTL